MDITEQLVILEAAQGDTAKLALLAVDLAYPAMSEAERMSLKETLEAVAIPHWCDENILAALLQISREEARAQLEFLRKLNVTELFPARGEDAVNVHEMTRLALRKQMQHNRKAYFRMLSSHAEVYFDGIPHTAASRIERLYHLLTANPERGVSECEILCQEWSGQVHLEDKYALVLALKELRTCELITDYVWAAIQLCVSRMSPGLASHLAGVCDETPQTKETEIGSIGPSANSLSINSNSISTAEARTIRRSSRALNPEESSPPADQAAEKKEMFSKKVASIRKKVVRKAVFPVAGFGTRFLPATKAVAREMLPITDRPLIQFAMDEAAAAGIEEIIFVTRPNKRSIEDYLYRAMELEAELSTKGKHATLKMLRQVIPSGVHFSFAQQEEPRGLGHAISCARRLVGNEPFAVLLPHDLIDGQPPVLAQMVAQYERVQSSLIAVRSVPREDTRRYGVVDAAAEEPGSCCAKIRSLVEKPAPEMAPSTMAIVGRYILSPAIFDCIAELDPGIGGEIQLTDAISRLLKLESVMTYRYQGKHYDCGSKAGFLAATVAYGLQHPEVGEEFREILLKTVHELAMEPAYKLATQPAYKEEWNHTG